MSKSSPPKDLNALTEEMNASFAQKQEVSSVQPWSLYHHPYHFIFIFFMHHGI